MINWTLLRLAKKIVNWFFSVDPYNGCDYGEAWETTVHDLAHDPQSIIDGLNEAIDYLVNDVIDLDLAEEGKALLRLIA